MYINIIDRIDLLGQKLVKVSCLAGIVKLL